jgi:hypothetical protein
VTIDAAECRRWAERTKASWEITPLIEMERGVQVQVGFDLELFARLPTDLPAGPDRAAEEALWDRLREIAESLAPLAGADSRVEVDPFDDATRLRPETRFAPEILLTARLFHGPNLLEPVRPGDRERLRPLEERLRELGLKPRSW